MTRNTLFTAIRPFAPNQRFTSAQIYAIDALADSFGMPLDAPALSPRGAAEIVGHEAIVQEAYKDSVGVWTWSVGITAASGVNVAQYKDNPQSLETCLQAYVERLNAVYIPAVLKAFGSKALNEAQFAAAVSFHYNTGAIGTTEWVKLFLVGDTVGARRFLETHYLNGGSLTERRKKEAALFFDGKWDGDGTAMVYPVSKPSYSPKWSGGKRVEVLTALKEIMA